MHRLILIAAAAASVACCAQERNAFGFDHLPVDKSIIVRHEWGFERLDVRDLVALTAEKRGKGRAVPVCSGRDCPDRQAKKPKPAQE